MVVAPAFVRLNDGWNAEPNAPCPEVTVEGSTLHLRFIVEFGKPPARLRFDNCRHWRLGPTNDEGWYLGQCRYSRIAPAWGQFYELVGEDGLLRKPTDWQTMPQPGPGDRHFLFYLRDDTFECYASKWSLADQYLAAKADTAS